MLKQREKPILFLSKILFLLVIISLIGLLALRIYAIYHTVPIRTWDDAGYRKYALKDASDDLSIGAAIQNVIFPNAHILDHTRSIGYHSWIVLALKLSLSGNYEQSFQLANLGLFLIQGIIVFLFSNWATKNKSFSGTLTFLYLSSPIVFGLNRWVMTDNFVMAGLLIFGCIPIWILNNDYQPFYRREILLGAIAAWVMGIFGSLREYAMPSYILTSVGTIFALGWVQRWDALWGFVGVFLLFFLTLLTGWIELMKFAAFKVTQSEYFHSLTEWLPHVIVNVIGVPLCLLFLILSILIIRSIKIAEVKRFIPKKWKFADLQQTLTSLHILWITNGILLLMYSLSILTSESRLARAGILIMIPLLNFLLIGIKVFELPNDIFRSRFIQVACIALIILAWSSSYYQLFRAFDGGKTFAHPAYDLEYYNYPFQLRPLVTPDDMHVK